MPSWLERMWDLYNSAPTPPRERDEGGDNAPPEQGSPGEDFDANAWLNVAQRRHDAWEAQGEQQQLLNTPLAQLMPRDLGAWAQAYLRSKAHEWTPEQATGFGYGFRRAEQEDNLSKWLEPIKRHYAAEQAAKPGTPTGEMTQPNEYGLTFPVTTPKPEEGIVNKWLGNFLPTPEEEELARRLPYGGIGSIPYAARAAGNLLAPIGAAHEAVRENVPGVGGFEDYILPGLSSLALGGGLDQQKRIYDPAFHSLSDEDQQTILSAQQRGEYAPPMTWDEQARLNAAMGRLDDKMQELRALDTRSVEERVRDAHEAYAKEMPLPAQAALGFIDPVYLALGLAGRGFFTSAEELAARAGANVTLAERLKRVLPGITKSRRLPGAGAPGALEEAADIEGAQAAKRLPKIGDLHPEAPDAVVLQPSNDLRENLALAAQSQPFRVRLLQDVERAVPGTKFVSAGVKTNMERIGEKVSKQPPSTISDYGRGRMSVETLDLIDPVIKELDKHAGVVQVDPFLSTPRQSGYFGVHAQIMTPNGSTSEVQILPREIAEVKEAADELYSIRRGPGISPERYQSLLAEEKKIFDEAARKFRQRTGITDQDLARIQRELKWRYIHLLPPE